MEDANAVNLGEIKRLVTSFSRTHPEQPVCLENNRAIVFSTTPKQDAGLSESHIAEFNALLAPLFLELRETQRHFTTVHKNQNSSLFTIFWNRNKQGIVWLCIGLLLVALYEIVCSQQGIAWREAILANVRATTTTTAV